jgi:ubiquinone biosynthesis protein
VLEPLEKLAERTARPKRCVPITGALAGGETRRPCNTDPVAQPAARNLSRLSEIAQVAVRHGFGYWFDTHRLTDLFPRRGPRVELDGGVSQRGQHLREMLDELGPTFVKFGQLLSTRPDVLPPDIITELRGLQDDVRPFPFEHVEQVVEDDLGLTLDKLFLEFEARPIAAASIGQVHRATLPNGGWR